MILDDWPIMKAIKINDDCAMLELVYAKKAIWRPWSSTALQVDNGWHRGFAPVEKMTEEEVCQMETWDTFAFVFWKVVD